MNINLIGIEGDGGRIFGNLKAIRGISVPSRRSKQTSRTENLLNDHGSVICELLEIGFKSKVIVHRLDVGRQDLTAMGDVGRARRHVGSAGHAHPSIGAVAFGNLGKGKTTGGDSIDGR